MAKIEQQAVARRMEWVRQQLGLTQAQLARQLNVSQAAISKYLNERIPPADVLYRLAVLGHTTVEWLLTGQKSYWFTESPAQVQEQEVYYDADLSIARRISRLSPEVRQALLTLLEHLT